MGLPEEYAEIVLTCEGDYYDSSFHVQLDGFRCRFEQLVALDSDKVVLKKVEPWNSVRLTLNIPRHAVTKLQELAHSHNGLLRSLGILSVQIEGDQAISLTLAGNNHEEPTQIVFKVPSDPSSALTTSSVTGSSSSDGIKYAALQQFAQLLSQNGNVSPDYLLKLATGNGGIVTTSASAANYKKHSAVTSHSPSALQSSSAPVQHGVRHASSPAAKGASRLDATNLSSNSPMLVNLLQNGAAWALGGGDFAAQQEQQVAMLAQPKKRVQRRKKKSEQLTNISTPAEASEGSSLAQNIDGNLRWGAGTEDGLLPLTVNDPAATPTISRLNVNDKIKQDSALAMDVTSESFKQEQQLSIEASETAGVSVPSSSYIASSGAVASAVQAGGLRTSNLVTGAGVSAPSVPGLPPGLMMMPLGGVNPAFGTMNSHNFLNAISLMPAQFLNLAALTTPTVSLPSGQMLVSSNANVTATASSGIQADVGSVTQAPDMSLITASSLSLFSQIMNQHIPALLVSQVPNSQTGTTNTSIIPVSVALGTPSLPLTVPSPLPSQASVPATSTPPLLLNPTAAAVAALFGMTSLFGNSPLPVPSNTTLVSSVTVPVTGVADFTVAGVSSDVSLLTCDPKQSMTYSSSNGSMSSSNVMSTISLDDVVDTLASVAALDGEVFTRLDDEHSVEESADVSHVKDSGGEVTSISNDGGMNKLPITKTELTSDDSVDYKSEVSLALVNGVISGKNSMLYSACDQVLSDTLQLSPKQLSVSDTEGTRCSTPSPGEYPLSSPSKSSESVHVHISASPTTVTTSAMTVAQASVTWATSTLMTVTKSEPVSTVADVAATTSLRTSKSQQLSPVVFDEDHTEGHLISDESDTSDLKLTLASLGSESLSERVPSSEGTANHLLISGTDTPLLDSNVDSVRMESGQSTMQETAAHGTVLPSSPKSNLPNTRSRRSLPFHDKQVTKQSTAGSVPLHGTVDELRSVVDSPVVVLPRIRSNGSSAFVSSSEHSTVVNARLARPALVRTGDTVSGCKVSVSSVADYTTLSQSATSLVPSIANGTSTTRSSGRNVVADNEAKLGTSLCLSAEDSLSSDNCSTAACLSANGPLSSDAIINSMDHTYPASTDTTHSFTAQSVGNNHTHVNNNTRLHKSGKMNSYHPPELATNSSSTVSGTNCENQPETPHNNNLEHRELRSRGKRPAQQQQHTTEETASSSCNGTPAKQQRLMSPISSEDQEEGPRLRGARRVRRKTDNSSVSETADDSTCYNRESDDSCSITWPSSANHQNAGSAEKTRSSSSPSPTLRRSSRSVKVKQHYETTVVDNPKRSRAHNTEMS